MIRLIPVKAGFNGPDLRPRISFLNPENTYSVSKFQTAAGSADILSHLFESYFNNTPGAYLQSRLAEGIMKTVIKYTPIAVNEPENYEARANLMYASSLGNNGLVVKGNPTSWAVHKMEHELTAFNDTTHGDGLAVLTPRWMRWVVQDQGKWYRFIDMGVNVFGIDATLPEKKIVYATIEAVEDFFWNKLGLHRQLREVGIEEKMLPVLTDRVAIPSTLKYLQGGYRPMTREDIYEVFKASY